MLWLVQGFLFYLISFSLIPIISCRKVNVTIDDQFGDPTNGQFIQYKPAAAWKPGQNCQQCSAKPTPIANAHKGTWMLGTFFPAGKGHNGVSGQILSATVPFVGTAVFVTAILTGSTTSPIGNSDYTFLIDNVTFGHFQQAPNGNKTYRFNQIIFSMPGLSNSLHTLTIETGHGGNHSIVLLDSVTYTKEINDNSSSTNNPNSGGAASSNVGVIVGPVIGGVAVAGAIIAFFFLRRRRQRGQRVRVLIDGPESTSLPFPWSPSSRGPGLVEPFVVESHHDETQSRGKGADVHYTPLSGAAASNGDLSSNSTRSPERNFSSHHFDTEMSVIDTAHSSTSDPQRVIISPLPSPPSYSEAAFPATSITTGETTGTADGIAKGIRTHR